MKTLPLKVSEEQVKNLIREWVDQLAKEKYEEALALLSTELPSGSGSVSENDANEWTPELLRAVISNYGLPEPWEGQEQTYKVVPVADAMRKLFEKSLTVHFRVFKAVGESYLGTVDVDLPLNYESGDWISDLTARFYLRKVSDTEMALVLLDIHVL
jgi:hypothetical protein